jgi:hypothetical protein
MFLEDNLDTQIDFFQRCLLRNKSSVYLEVNYDIAQEYIDESTGRLVDAELKFISYHGNYEFSEVATNDFIDATMKDFAGECIPDDLNFKLVEFVKKNSNQGDVSVFYYHINPDKLEDTIDVHLVAPHGSYIRQRRHWKLMASAECSWQNNTMKFLIDPRRGREFLKKYDDRLLDFDSAREYTLEKEDSFFKNDFSYFGLDDFETDFGLDDFETDFGLDDFETDQSVYVYHIKSLERPGGMESLQSFDIDGGKLIIKERQWAVMIPYPNWDHVTDIASIFLNLCDRLPSTIPYPLSSKDWVNEFNSMCLDLFKVNTVPTSQYEGSFDDIVHKLILESNSTHGNAVMYGKE